MKRRPHMCDWSIHFSIWPSLFILRPLFHPSPLLYPIYSLLHCFCSFHFIDFARVSSSSCTRYNSFCLSPIFLLPLYCRPPPPFSWCSPHQDSIPVWSFPCVIVIFVCISFFLLHIVLFTFSQSMLTVSICCRFVFILPPINYSDRGISLLLLDLFFFQGRLEKAIRKTLIWLVSFFPSFSFICIYILIVVVVVVVNRRWNYCYCCCCCLCRIEQTCAWASLQFPICMCVI